MNLLILNDGLWLIALVALSATGIVAWSRVNDKACKPAPARVPARGRKG